MMTKPTAGLSRSIIARFAFVGLTGFIVDATALTYRSQAWAWNIYGSRAISFFLATAVTWLLNRTFVFDARRRIGRRRSIEYGRYFLVQLGGACLNLAVFAALISGFPALHSIPVLPLAVGAGLGMIFNFTGSLYWVFGAVYPEAK